jgi:hypothetical protein
LRGGGGATRSAPGWHRRRPNGEDAGRKHGMASHSGMPVSASLQRNTHAPAPARLPAAVCLLRSLAQWRTSLLVSTPSRAPLVGFLSDIALPYLDRSVCVGSSNTRALQVAEYNSNAGFGFCSFESTDHEYEGLATSKRVWTLDREL